MKDDQDDITSGKFYEWQSHLTMDTFTKELVSDASVKHFSGQFLQLLYKSFAGATESGGAMGGCSFGETLPINVPKR